jgi:hypothetical protein
VRPVGGDMTKRRIGALLAGAGAVGAALVLASVQGGAGAATPPSGSVSAAQPDTSWIGMQYALATTPVPESCPPVDPLNLVCDHFSLTVVDAGGVDVSISWASSDNDFDLFVYDSGGNEVGHSNGSGNTSEHVFVPSAQGTYEVLVVPFLVIDSGYNGSAHWGASTSVTRTSGGLAFGPATVIDGQRTVGEPINHIDKYGHYWETGPWGFSTGQSFLHKSVDGGNQFNIDSPLGIRPDPPPGGGDSDIVTDDQGFAYFVDLEGPTAELGVGVSNDGGNTWAKKNVASIPPLADRQWFAVDNGLTEEPGDNTVFLAYNEVAGNRIFSSPGSTGTGDLTGGLVYQDSSASLAPLITPGVRCGELRFDPVQRNLYYPCSGGTHTRIIVGHVSPGQRTGITYTIRNSPESPGGGNTAADLFPVVAVDKAGTLYSVWIDSADHNVYYSASKDAGQTWGPVIRVNGNDANSNVFLWAVAGNAGTLVVDWYGNSSHVDSDVMPNWANDREGATAFPWYGYVSVIKNADTATPAFAQARFTEKPMHYGQICTSGIACTTGGDRTMADFQAVNLDLNGAIRIVYNDTTSQHHGAHLFEERQLAGPTGLGTTLSGSAASNPVADPTGDAQSPHYAPTGAGPNLPQFDFTQVKLSQPTAGTVRVQMTLNSLASLTPPSGKANSLWLTRFQALSIGDQGEEAYRIFYVGAESNGVGPPTFFAGSGLSDQDGVKNNGCFTTTPENCKVLQYPAEVSAKGSISGNVITIDVPVQGGFGPNRPIDGNVLYNVTALSAGRNPVPASGPTTAEFYADLDATRTFDYTLTSGGLGTCATGQEVKGEGHLHSAGAGKEAHFSLHTKCEEKKLTGKVEYVDDGAVPSVKFHSTHVTGVTIDPSMSTATITGDGVNNKKPVSFTVQVKAGRDASASFSIELTDGTTNSGSLTKGQVEIRSK